MKSMLVILLFITFTIESIAGGGADECITTVGFYARTRYDEMERSTCNDCRVSFREVLTNVGNGLKYSKFTAPVKGQYYFEAIVSAENAPATLMLKKNGAVISRSKIDDLRAVPKMGMTSASLFLNKGDQVDVRYSYTYSSYAFIYFGRHTEGAYTHFLGYRIRV